MLVDKTVREVIEAFSANIATPGGGSASALGGAIATALLMMVAALPTKRATDEDRGALSAASAQLVELRDRLTDLIDRDSEAYDTVVAAYQMRRGPGEELGRARTAAIQDALKRATETPLEMMRACTAALQEALAVARHGRGSASSDVRVAVEFLSAALRGARYNTEINLESITDETYRAGVRAEVDALGATAERHARAVGETLSRNQRI
ncbi:MAG: cyclodeaminase/cyclohydrolase family protein [Acidobacteria bacterium]|nr:cyclodeaminase/cyclohydrolase family protein [Acidobacteriota bacterium]